MPFSAILNEEKIYSFKFTEDEWSILKANKNKNILMPCCDSEVVLKTSKLGTRYFSHKPKVNCGYSSPETVEHLFCKYLVAKTLHELGWTVETEKEGVTPSGKKWIADIYAEKNNQKMCIEIQWSSQTVEDTELRHNIYEESGIRCLWLMRFPTTIFKYEWELSRTIEKYNKNANVLYLKKDDDGAFKVGGFYKYALAEKGTTVRQMVSFELVEFLTEMLLEKNVKKINLNKIQKYIRANYHESSCWKCNRKTNIVVEFSFFIYMNGLYINIRNNEIDLLNEEIEYGGIETQDATHIIDLLNTQASSCNFGLIKRRFSKTVGDSYYSNGCKHCDALQGRHFYIHLGYDVKHYSEPVEVKESLNIFSEKDSLWLFNGS